MAIALRGTPVSAGGLGGGTGVGSFNINRPAGVVLGDVIYIEVYTGTNTDHPVSTGFTEVAFKNDGIANNVTVLRKIATGSEPASYTVTCTGAMINASIWANSGQDTTTPEDTAATLNNGTGATLTIPGITTVTDGAWWVAIMETTGNATTLSLPTGFTNDVPPYGALGDFARVDHKSIASHGATGTASSTQDDTGGWITISLALRPAAGSPTSDTEPGTLAVNIPHPRVGPQALRALFRFRPWPFSPTLAPKTDNEPGTEVVNLPNPRVGPPALRLKFRTPPYPFSATQAPLTDTEPGTEAVVIPNRWVGPTVLRRLFRGIRPVLDSPVVIQTTTPSDVDAGVGTESTQVTGAPTDIDAGVGTETFTVLGLPTATDTGAGGETFQVTGAPSASESGSGTEGVSTTATVGNAENGAGSEATSTLAVVGLSDSGAGSESTTTTGSVPAPDSGAGAESFSVVAVVGSAQSGSGTETPSTLAVVGLSDTGSGLETTSTTGSVTTPDSGAGSESVVVTLPGSATPTCSDAGTGSESTSITIIGVITPPVSGDGHHGGKLRLPFVERPHGFGITKTTPAFSQRWNWSDDRGSGTESAVVSATIAVYDTGLGWAFPQPPAINPFDEALGSESADVQKFEDPDSEFRTIMEFAKAGAFTDSELSAILLDHVILLEKSIRKLEDNR